MQFPEEGFAFPGSSDSSHGKISFCVDYDRAI